MNPNCTPDAVCVSVSTAEKPVYNRDLYGPLNVDTHPGELEAIRHLIKECGWYWTDAGVMKRHRFGRVA